MFVRHPIREGGNEAIPFFAYSQLSLSISILFLHLSHLLPNLRHAPSFRSTEDWFGIHAGPFEAACAAVWECQ